MSLDVDEWRKKALSRIGVLDTWEYRLSAAVGDAIKFEATA